MARPGEYKYVHEALVPDYLSMGWQFAEGDPLLYCGEYMVYILFFPPCPCGRKPPIHHHHRRKSYAPRTDAN